MAKWEKEKTNKTHEVDTCLNFVAVAAGLKVEQAGQASAFMLFLGCHCLRGHCNLSRRHSVLKGICKEYIVIKRMKHKNL